MENLFKLKGVKTLNKNEQKNINGGKIFIECSLSADVDTDWCCHFGCI